MDLWGVPEMNSNDYYHIFLSQQHFEDLLKKFLLVFSFIFAMNVVDSAQWVQTNGPYGGNAHSLAISGNDIFACFNGEVFRSTDYGSSWNSANMTDLASNWIVADSENIFVGTGGIGIYHSTNKGVNWNTVNNGLPSFIDISNLAIIGKNLFASTLNGTVKNPKHCVYRSTNSGSSWVSSNVGLENIEVNVFSSGQSSTGDTNIFAGTSNGVFVSTNNGELWSSIGLGNTNISSIAIIPNGTNNPSIFAGSIHGISLSTDTGLHWSFVNSGITDTLISALSVSYNISGDPNIIAGTQGGNVYISNNRGRSWDIANTGLITGTWEWGDRIFSFNVSGNYIYVCTIAGIFLSTNNGLNWKSVNYGAAFATVNALAVASNNTVNNTIIAGTFLSGIFLSSENGSNWVAANNGIHSIDINALAINGKYIFAGSSTGVFLSTNNGISWDSVGLNGKEVVSLLATSDSRGNSVILAGTWDGAFISTNNGGIWISIGLSTNDVESLAVITDDSTIMNIYAGTRGSGIFLSTNKGASWIPKNTGLPMFSNIQNLFYHGHNLFAINEYDSLLYISTDKGSSWKPRLTTTSHNDIIDCLTFNPESGGESDIYVGTSQGLMVSKDNGLTWHSFNEGFTDINIRSLVISGSYIYAGGNGVWRRPLSDFVTGVKDKKNNLPTSFSLNQNYPNPFNPTTTINYSVPKSGFVTLKVYDVLGREVTTLVNENKPIGNYSVQINASKLVSGIYFYRMQAGDFVQTKKLILLK